MPQNWVPHVPIYGYCWTIVTQGLEILKRPLLQVRILSEKNKLISKCNKRKEKQALKSVMILTAMLEAR